MIWDPNQYARFGGERLRPASDLLAAVPLEAPRRIADLGCGNGTATALLAARWPAAEILGVDDSSEMLAAAAGLALHARWLCTSIADWQPGERYDLVFSNAALHWLPNHTSLLPRLLGVLNEGGVLAVQMPRNFAAPSHTLLFDLAESARWRERLARLVRRKPVEAPEWYYRLLAPLAHCVTLWETEYWQPLSGDRPVVAWVKGTWLKPFLDALGADAQAFELEYTDRIAAAYPPERNGLTLFPFRRLFFVAVR